MDNIIYPLFFLIAFFHSSIGLGGGSSYTALLLLSGISYTIAPSISLILNLLVSGITTFQYYQKKHLSIHKLFPFILCSIPFSYLGGMIFLSKTIFIFLIIICLIIIIIKLLLPVTSPKIIKYKQTYFFLSLIIGSLLGFISGLIGIGGGIFLVPILIIFRLASIKQAAACGAAFIFINSFFGLLARYHNHQYFIESKQIIIYLGLITSLGGFFGSYWGSKKFSPSTLKKILIIILIIVCFLIIKKL